MLHDRTIALLFDERFPHHILKIFLFSLHLTGVIFATPGSHGLHAEIAWIELHGSLWFNLLSHASFKDILLSMNKNSHIVGFF